MREYETVFILDPNLDDGEVKGEIDKVQSLISGLSGEVLGVESGGKKRLAYEIAGRKEGYYTLITFRSEPSSIAELERAYNLNERVLRHIIVHRADKRVGTSPGEQGADIQG
jgi:small subunit ribosomal protein S6